MLVVTVGAVSDLDLPSQGHTGIGRTWTIGCGNYNVTKVVCPGLYLPVRPFPEGTAALSIKSGRFF